MLRLLPRGDCWIFERNSIFFKIVKALSQEFDGTYNRLTEVTQAFYPETDTSIWKDSLLFHPFPSGLYTLSTSSIHAQLEYYQIHNVELVAPIEEPFVLYLHIESENEKCFSAGSQVGGELYHWRDEKLEAQLLEIIPAFIKPNFIYRSVYA